MGLNQEQQEVCNDILRELYSGTKRIILSGSAGVGKTFLMGHLVNKIQEDEILPKAIYVSAPTHKALSVLKSKIDPMEDLKEVKFMTVHSGLNLKRKFGKDGKVFFYKNKRGVTKYENSKALIIIDEASMLGKDLIKFTDDLGDNPILFVGDEKQINPVNESTSPVFDQFWLQMSLKTIVRQAESNPIINLSRDLSKVSTKEHNVTEEGVGYLFSNDREKVIERLAEANGTDAIKYLAYTNAEVDSINNAVRRSIYGSPSLLEEGEVIIVNSPIKSRKTDSMYHTNEEVYIDTVEVMTKKFPLPKGMLGGSTEFKVYDVNHGMYAIHEDSVIDFMRIMKFIKDECINGTVNWKDLYDFKESFLDFKYNHAITVHKSQGSTYETAIVNVGNINRIRKEAERRKLLYTAVTRPSTKLVLFNVV